MIVADLGNPQNITAVVEGEYCSQKMRGEVKCIPIACSEFL
jgi:hypothetical protein